MKILWVKAGKLLPVDTGGKIRSYNLLQCLRARHEVKFLSYYGGQRDVSYETEISRQLPGAFALHVPQLSSDLGLTTALDYLRHSTSPAPYAVNKFTAPAVKGILATWLCPERVDVTVCDFLSASLNFPACSSVPVVLFQHNVEGELWKRLAANEANWVRRLVYRLEAAKMVRYESRTVAKFDFVIAVSERDRKQMAMMTDPNRIAVSATGVDCAKCGKQGGSRTNNSLVVFTGSMDWEPNVDAVEYFCNEVWPLVRKSIPHARFRIVGRNPHRRVRELACDSIEVTGTVSSVIEHLREATVVVVPLRIGGGTRLKIYEAMATGKAVVSTTIGAEGLDVQPGKDILLADDPVLFSSSVSALLASEELRERIGTAATQKAARYDWCQVAVRFEELLRHAIDMRTSQCPQSATV